MKAVVLVGGEGTRLRPLTYTRPKQMLPVGDATMLERVLSWLAGHDIDEAVLSLGYRPDAFLDAYPDGKACGVNLRYAVEESPLDTAGAIRFAACEAGFDRDTFVVVNGDVLTDLDVGSLVELHRSRRAEATIALTPVEDPSAFGVVPTEADGRVIAFIEKPPREEAPTNLINAGTYILEPTVLERIPTGRKVSIERETFPALVADEALYALGSDAAWIDAGTPATLLRSNLGYAPTGEAAGEGLVEGSVVGRDVTVAAGAKVAGSVLMDGVTIGRDATVISSILGPGVQVGAGARVADLSVLGESYRVDAGVELSGARLPPP